MNKSTIKFTAVFTAIIIVLGMFSFLPADIIRADDVTYTELYTQSYLNANNMTAPEGAYVIDDTNETPEHPFPSSGAYRLMCDLEKNDNTIITGNLTIDLNGRAITTTGDKRMFTLTESSGCTFTLNDSVGTGSVTGNGMHRFIYINKSSSTDSSVRNVFILNGGTLSNFSGNSSNTQEGKGQGGCLKICPNSLFVMNGGRITNCTVSGGSSNSPAGMGGAVSLDTGAYMIMTGGSIDHNTANKNGGGIRVGRGYFTMIGGSITNNSVETSGTSGDGYGGGGIYANASITVGGTAVIDGNTSGNGFDNALMFRTNSINGDPVKINEDPDNPLTDGARISVSSENYSKYNPLSNLSEEDLGYFTCDNPNYVFTARNNKIIVAANTIDFDSGYTLLLGEGKIGFRFYVSLPDYTSADTITFDNGTAVSFEGSEEIGGTMYYYATHYVLPVEMSRPVSVMVTTNGQNYVLTSISVRDYAHAIIAGDYSSQAKALAKAILNFGTACQKVLGSTYSDANDLSGYGDSTSTGSVTSTLSGAPEFTVPAAGSYVSYYGTSLIMQSRPVIRHYFSLVGDADITLVSISANGNTYTALNELTTAAGTRYFYIDIENVDPWQYGTAYDVVASYGGSADLSFTYCVRNYFSSVANNAALRSNTALYNACCAMDDYYAASAAYLGV